MKIRIYSQNKVTWIKQIKQEYQAIVKQSLLNLQNIDILVRIVFNVSDRVC